MPVINISCLLTETQLSYLNSNYWWNYVSCSVRHLSERLGWCRWNFKYAAVHQAKLFLSIWESLWSLYFTALGCMSKVPGAGEFFCTSKTNSKKYVKPCPTWRQFATANSEDGPFCKALLFFNDFIIILKMFLLLDNGADFPDHM